jgi:hypothetical protein
MDTLPLHIQTLYAELISQCLAGSGPTGSLYEQVIKGDRYTYLKSQIGVVRKDSYIGRSQTADTLAARERIERANASLQNRKQLVQTLKRHLPSPHATAARVVDVLKWGGLMGDAVLVGTNAYTCYPALVGSRLQGEVMATDDTDIATMNLALKGSKADVSFLQLLQLADPTFRPVPSFAKAGLPSQFKADNGYRVDLLTQMRSSRSESAVPLANIQAGAMPLQHMKWLMDDPALAVVLFGPGLLVQVPQPARYAVHKLIVAQKRNPAERLKRRKDLTQARSLVEVLSKSDPGALLDAYESACAQGKVGWKKPVDMSLRALGLSIG